MPDNFVPTNIDYIRILPEIILTVTGLLVMFLEAILKESQKRIFAPLALLGLVAAMAGAITANSNPGVSFNDMVVVDGFATPADLVAYYQQNFGPTIMAYRSLGDDAARRAEFDDALLSLATRANLAPAGEPARWEFEYALIVAKRG